MPTKNEVNRLVEVYGLGENDWLVVADTTPLPVGENGTPKVKAQAWYRCGDCKTFDFGHYIQALPEDCISKPYEGRNQETLSIDCCGSIGKRIGVVRYALTA